MDSAQDQMNNLNAKVDVLHGVTEQLRDQITEILSEIKEFSANKSSFMPSETHLGHYSYQSRHSFNAEMEHKDVLMDDKYPDANVQSGDRVLAPEVQIQRLTAQLTAAYNRIAALEEQLMAKRVF